MQHCRTGTPGKLIIVFGVAICCIACSDNPPAVSPATMDSGLSVTMSLDKSSYKIGEPIFATLRITNVSTDTLHVGTGGDYRSGRSDRFAFQVKDTQGNLAPDPLRAFSGFMMMGGLGSSIVLARGQTYTAGALLNLYTAPRIRGTHIVNGTYRLSLDNQQAGNKIIKLPPVTFEMRGGESRLSESQMRARLDEFGFEGVHACIIHGMQNETGRIGKLLKIAGQERPRGAAARELKPYELNAHIAAMQAICLMQDKEKVYRVLEQEIVDGGSEQDPWELMHSPLGTIYRASATPDAVSILERAMEHDNPRVREMAFITALSMGSAKALEVLPAALRSGDDFTWNTAMNQSMLYILRANTPPDSELAMNRLDRDRVRLYEDALLDAFREIDSRDKQVSTTAEDAWNFPLIVGFAYHTDRVWEAVDIAVQSQSPDKHLAALRFLALSDGRSFGPIENEKIQQYLPFVRMQAEESPDPKARDLAGTILKQWGTE